MECQNESCNINFNPKTHNQRFCSQRCRNAHGQRRLRERHSGNCMDCETQLRTLESIRCKKCVRQNVSESIKAMNLREYIDTHPRSYESGKMSPIRNFARSWNPGLPSHCQLCGYDIHIEFAHIKAITSFPDTALLSEINAPDNLLVLCRNHHWEYDHEILQLKDIPPR